MGKGLINKKFLKLDEKTRKKTGGVLINEQPPELDEKMKKKTDLLCDILQR